ncbi:MAG: hypothetical protein MJ162_04300 [Treponema sp.]|nr:hypothetical protein [Treponema sp.]
MFDDVESDFWKNKIVQLQKANMSRKDEIRFNLDQAKTEIENFSKNYPDYTVEITNTESYITWEIFLTETIKFRLYIQSQIKASILQVNGGDLVKVCDAKFFNNPFPEVYSLLKELSVYVEELNTLKAEHVRFQKQQTLTFQLLKAMLIKKAASYEAANNCKLIYTTSIFGNGFAVEYEKNGNKLRKLITMQNFKSEIKDFEF